MLSEIFRAAVSLVQSPITAYDALLTKHPFKLVRRIVILSMTPILAVYVAGSWDGPLRYILVAFTPLFSLLSWVLQAGILTLFTRIMGSKGSFRTNLLIFGYAQSPMLMLLPALLLPLGFLYLLTAVLNTWSVFFLYIGLARGHQLSRGRQFFVLLGSQFLLPALAVSIVLLLSH